MGRTVGIVFTEAVASQRTWCKPIGQSSRSRKYPFLERRIATGLSANQPTDNGKAAISTITDEARHADKGNEKNRLPNRGERKGRGG